MGMGSFSGVMADSGGGDDDVHDDHDISDWRMGDEPEAFEPLGTPPNRSRRMRTWVLTVFAIVVATALVCTGLWTLNMWDHHWRRIPISVNGNSRMVRADTTLGGLVRDNAYSDVGPGKLLSISGKVINPRGGFPIAYSVNGKRISANHIGATTLPEHAKIVLSSGANRTEPHTVKREVIPFSVTMNGRGAIQMVTQHGKDGMRETWIGKDSHEQVDKGVSDKPKDLVVTSISPRPANRKVIALTFDDGPSQYSDPILDILKSRGVKATFFDIGKSALQYPKQERRMAAEGHEVASHSNTHPDMTTLSADAMREDIMQGLANLKNASGTTTKTFRAPYGAFKAEQWRNASDLLDYNVLWNIDTEDWKRPGADKIHNAVLANAYNGAIVLMHDGGGNRDQDVQALPRIIDDLKAQGYEFMTIDQLVAMNKQ